MLGRDALELVLGLHETRAMWGGKHGGILQTVLEGSVPDAVRLRPKETGLYRAFIPRVLTSPRARQALSDGRVRSRLCDLVRFERVDAMLGTLAAGRPLATIALWHLECLTSFAEWYAHASRDYGVD
jgi:hypothetical protein